MISSLNKSSVYLLPHSETSACNVKSIQPDLSFDWGDHCWDYNARIRDSKAEADCDRDKCCKEPDLLGLCSRFKTLRTIAYNISESPQQSDLATWQLLRTKFPQPEQHCYHMMYCRRVDDSCVSQIANLDSRSWKMRESKPEIRTRELVRKNPGGLNFGGGRRKVSPPARYCRRSGSYYARALYGTALCNDL